MCWQQLYLFLLFYFNYSNILIFRWVVGVCKAWQMRYEELSRQHTVEVYWAWPSCSKLRTQRVHRRWSCASCRQQQQRRQIIGVIPIDLWTGCDMVLHGKITLTIHSARIMWCNAMRLWSYDHMALYKCVYYYYYYVKNYVWRWHAIEIDCIWRDLLLVR